MGISIVILMAIIVNIESLWIIDNLNTVPVDIHAIPFRLRLVILNHIEHEFAVPFGRFIAEGYSPSLRVW